MKNQFKHNDDGTTHIFVESKRKQFPGKHTIIIDTEDWDKVKEHRWCIYANKTHKYPYANTSIPHPDGGWRYYTKKCTLDTGEIKSYQCKSPRITKLMIHNLIMGRPEEGLEVDHINHIGLDNRKANLRIVTRAQNQQNTKAKRGSSSQYKGVSYNKRSAANGWACWQVDISKGTGHQRERFYLGRFTCEKEAALAYNKKAIELWGEYALLNEAPEERIKETLTNG